MNWNRNTDNATAMAGAHHSLLHDPHTVVVNRPTARTKTGGIHKGSRAAIIAQARKENPRYADAAVVELFYGTEDSTNTVIRFKPTERAFVGL